MSTEPSSTEVPDTAETLQLSSTEVRILGCLIEKQATNPETYPLTLNALVLACNQKTSRDPVMNLTQGQVGQSLRALEGQGLTRLVMGSRADRWEHKVDKGLELVPAQVILTGLLLYEARRPSMSCSHAAIACTISKTPSRSFINSSG